MGKGLSRGGGSEAAGAPSRKPDARGAQGKGSPRVALLVKRTSWGLYIEDLRDPRLRRLRDEGDPAVERLKAAHTEHESTVVEVKAALDQMGLDWTLVRRTQAGFDSSKYDLVVTVGGDGTLLSASHSVVDVPILGINSAPTYSVGFFCGAKRGEVALALGEAIGGSLKRTTLTRMKVSLNGKIVAARVLNDALFCHASPAATSRYVLELDGVLEEQKSSGFWIGPAAGSTAAQRSAGGRVLPLTSRKLQLVVREPYTPHGERYKLRHALIPPGRPLVARSKIHEAKIFFDGPDNVVDIGFGDVIEFTQAEKDVTLLGISSKRGWGRR